MSESIGRREPYGIDEDAEVDGVFVLAALHARYWARTAIVHGGRNRNVFDFGAYVVKLPKNGDGCADNDWEGSLSNGESLGDMREIQYARTRMAYWRGVPVVFMEKVEHARPAEIVARLGYEPDWTMSVDCGQVGFTRDGRLVAYDYGLR